MIEIGSKIDGRYRVTGRIAHGGMADVYEGFDSLSHRYVAIKVMRVDCMADPENIKRFRKECEACACFNSPHIVRIYGQGTVDGGRPYMINEYVEGRTLRDKLNMVENHCLSAREACEFMVQLCLGMQYVHDHGVVHRDIKPDNMFYAADGSVKITDFGISSHVGEKANREAIPGTLFYTAPEIITGGDPLIQSDIFSMGVVFYEMLTGKLPFSGEDKKAVVSAIVKKSAPIPSDEYSSIPKAVDRIVIKCLRKRHQERYQSCNQLRRAIESVLKDKNAFKEKKSLLSKIFGFK